MSMADTIFSAVKANPKIALKLLTNAKPLWDAVQSAGFTEEDIVGLITPGAQPTHKPSSVALPQKGFLLDHEGKSHSVEDLGTRMLEQLTAAAAPAPAPVEEGAKAIPPVVVGRTSIIYLTLVCMCAHHAYKGKLSVIDV